MKRAQPNEELTCPSYCQQAGPSPNQHHVGNRNRRKTAWTTHWRTVCTSNGAWATCTCTNPVQQLLHQPHRTHWESSCNGSSSPLSGSLPPAALTRTCSTTVRQVHPQKRPVCLPGPVCPQTRPARPQREAPSTAPLLMALLPVSAVIKSRSRALTTAKVQHPKVKSKRFPTPWYSTFPEHLTFPSYISHQINTINTINKPGYRLVIPKCVANAKFPPTVAVWRTPAVTSADKEIERQQWTCSLVPASASVTKLFTLRTKRTTPCERVLSPSLSNTNFTIPL